MFNLPGTKEYDCQRPWVFNKRIDVLLAVDLFIYVDYGRHIRPTETFCWGSSRRRGFMCLWLGIQDASIKFQPPPQSPGTWSGTIVNTEGVVHGLVSQDILDKTLRLLLK